LPSAVVVLLFPNVFGHSCFPGLYHPRQTA